MGPWLGMLEPQMGSPCVSTHAWERTPQKVGTAFFVTDAEALDF